MYLILLMIHVIWNLKNSLINNIYYNLKSIHSDELWQVFLHLNYTRCLERVVIKAFAIFATSKLKTKYLLPQTNHYLTLHTHINGKIRCHFVCFVASQVVNVHHHILEMKLGGKDNGQTKTQLRFIAARVETLNNSNSSFTC